MNGQTRDIICHEGREMKFDLQTSLLALIFAVGASDAIAAPAVRSLGGFVPASDASSNVTSGTSGAGSVAVPNGMASRAGSLRSAPRATVSSMPKPAGDSTGATGSSVSRAASTSAAQRLSIGSYIGAPKQISTSGTNTEEITNINNDIKNITNIVEGLETDISGKVDKEQGIAAAGQGLVVDSTGFVTTADIVTPEELNVDLSTKVDKDQGIVNKGKALLVDDAGYVIPGDVLKPGDIDLSTKVDKLQGREYKNKALVVGADGIVRPTGDFMAAGEVDLSGKVDKLQGANYEGKTMVVDQWGYLQPTGDFVETDQGTENEGKALLINAQGKVVPGDVDFTGLETNISGKVDKFQGPDNVDKVLVVDEEGYVADEKLRNVHVADDAALERKKMATDITDTLDWVDTWKNQAEDSETGDYKLDPNSRYVMAVDEFGEKAWFRVVVDE